ncbi:MAG: hypothetical protein F6K37_01520 [Moorea sp. SIO4E2]|nr:hypothetical protein [Moorena sp. SIO4E2]NEQ04717.1 hypothetical protein [Moorena sp. SIO4E2]
MMYRVFFRFPIPYSRFPIPYSQSRCYLFPEPLLPVPENPKIMYLT